MELRKTIGGLVPFSEVAFKEACQMKERTNPPGLWFSICADGHIVGITGLHQIKYIQRNAEVSIIIGEEEDRNRGTATKTIKMLEEYAFQGLQMHRLYANVFADNYPSIRLFTKCDWVKEGMLRDAACWNGDYKNLIVFGRVNY